MQPSLLMNERGDLIQLVCWRNRRLGTFWPSLFDGRRVFLIAQTCKAGQVVSYTGQLFPFPPRQLHHHPISKLLCREHNSERANWLTENTQTPRKKTRCERSLSGKLSGWNLIPNNLMRSWLFTRANQLLYMLLMSFSLTETWFLSWKLFLGFFVVFCAPTLSTDVVFLFPCVGRRFLLAVGEGLLLIRSCFELIRRWIERLCCYWPIADVWSLQQHNN
jgi:hypothetical protein